MFSIEIEAIGSVCFDADNDYRHSEIHRFFLDLDKGGPPRAPDTRQYNVAIHQSINVLMIERRYSYRQIERLSNPSFTTNIDTTCLP